jgi:large subunit ribosomal protein L29
MAKAAAKTEKTEKKTAKKPAKSAKTAKVESMTGKTADELKTIVAERKKELLNLRFQKAAGQLENTARFKEARKEIARAKTALGALNKNVA